MFSRFERGRSGLRTWALLALVAAFVVGFTASPLSADSDKRVVKVMTYNMDAGTDFLYFFALPFEDAVQATIAELQATDFAGRAGLLADQIAAEQPYLISLQEVTLYDTITGSGQRVGVLADQLALLEDALAERHLHYKVVAVQPLTHFAVPLVEDLSLWFRYLDRNVILARTDLSQAELALSNVRSGIYDATIEVLPGVIEVNGWMSVDAKIRGKSLRFFATHLEAAISATDPTQVLQGQELIGIMEQSPIPVIVAGDFNSDASGLGVGPDLTPTASMIVGAGYADVWQELRPSELGLTWPLYLEDIYAGPATPTERIDLIFARGFDFLDIDRLGAASPFPSDHAGVVATLRIEK